MTGAAQRPLLFLDVDGPLIPFGAAEPYPRFGPDPGRDGNPLLARLDPAHGPRLAALPCDLVWATTWLADANDAIAPRLGLPPLAVVDWPEPSDLDEHAGTHWKTPAVVDYAAGRPFVWVDDEITNADRTWVRAHHPGPALLHQVDPRVGLTAADYASVGGWLRQP